jgi:IS5 family transposase
MGRKLHQQITFADAEFQGLRPLDPVLQAMTDFLDQQHDLVEAVRKDLQRGLKHPDAGREGIAPSQVLRSLILMRVKNWDYRELRERIDDGLTLRSFTQFDSQVVPKHDAFNRAFMRITPRTLREINQKVMGAAVKLGLEDGQTLRVDTTVVETCIRYPTDAGLLWDSVRTLTALVHKVHQILPRGVQGFTNRTKSARRRMQEIQRMSAAQRVHQQAPKYRELLRITEQVVNNARDARQQARRAQTGRRASVLDVLDRAKIDQLSQQIGAYCDLADRVIDQTRGRVMEGEPVPADEKIY